MSAIAVDPKDGGLVLAGTYAGKLDFGGECAALVNGDALRRHLFVVKLLPKKVEPDGG
ncbi:MAG: hypothetical protein U0359_01365 [Byssovorax sp.]